jgi:hypothetical protein
MCASHLLRIVDNALPGATITRGSIIGSLWRLGPLCCRRANEALRSALTIDYGPSLPPTEIITGVLMDPVEALAAARD